MGAVVVVAVDLPAAVEQAFESNRQVFAGRVVDGEMIEPGGAALRRLAVFALPGVERNVMVIAAGERNAAVPML